MRVVVVEENPTDAFMDLISDLRDTRETWEFMLCSSSKHERSEMVLDRTFTFCNKDTFLICIARAMPADLVLLSSSNPVVSTMALDVVRAMDGYDIKTISIIETLLSFEVPGNRLEGIDARCEFALCEKSDVLVFGDSRICEYTSKRYRPKYSVIVKDLFEPEQRHIEVVAEILERLCT